MHLLHCDRIYLSEKYRRVFEFLLSPAQRKMLLLPRGTYKSTLLCGYVAREIVRNPDIRILYGSETYAQSKEYIAWVRRQFESNTELTAIAGNMVSRQDWRADKFTVAKRKDLAKKESTLTAAGIDVTKVGMHYDLIIIDDCVSNTNVMTAGQMQKTLNWYRLLNPILDPGGTMIVCGTRYDEEDLYGTIVRNNNELEAIWDSTPEERRRPELMPFEIMVEKAEVDGKPHFKHLDADTLRVKRVEMGPYIYACTPTWAPVWMADGTFKPIGDVQPGEMVMGYGRPGGRRTRLIPSRVVEARSRMAEVLELRLSNGDYLHCTADHRWFTGRHEKRRKLYDVAHVGSKMHKAINPSAANAAKGNGDLWRYLAGLFDGEGSCSHVALTITQSESVNPAVCSAIRDTLAGLGISWKEYRHSRKPGCILFNLHYSKQLIVDLISAGRPAKAGQLVKFMLRHGGRPVVDEPRVVEIASAGEMQVRSLQTETGNYVSQGYLSSNCQMQNDPSTRENSIFSRDMFKIVPASQIPKALNLYMLTDSATTSDGCQSALFVIGKDLLDNVYVLDGWASPATPDQFEKMFFSIYTKWWPRHFLMEKVPINDNYATMLLRSARERQIPIRLEWVMGRSTESKDERIISMQARFAAGRIFFSDAIPKDLICLQGQEAYGDIPRQFCRFRPRSGSRNDIPDCLSDMDKRDHRSGAELCPAPRFRKDAVAERPGTVNGQFNLGARRLARRRPGPAARENFWDQQRRLSDQRRNQL